MVQPSTSLPHQPATASPGRRAYDLIRAQIADGSLALGAPVPSTRALAQDLGISRTTVTAAYEQLAAEGYVVTAPGRATRVASSFAAASAPPAGVAPQRVPAGAPSLSRFGHRVAGLGLQVRAPRGPGFIDFLYGAVASRDFPAHLWRRAYLAELLRQQQHLCYAPPEGDAGLRQALQGYLRRARGVACDAEQVLIVHGAQQAIDLCARLLLDADSSFAVEDPGYLMARRSFAATGAELLPIPVDGAGMVTARLPKGRQVRLACVTPSHQFPLGGILPVARRRELLDWARASGAWVVEDDYDGEFRYGQRPIDALQAFDTEGQVIYIGTFSKVLSPQLRLGYMVLPPQLVPVFRRAKQITDRHAPVLEQRVLATLLDSGAYERHVRRTRRGHERRRVALLAALAQALPAQAEVVGAAAGLHVVVRLPGLAPAHEAGIVHLAGQRGIGVYPLSPLYANPNATGATGTPGVAGLILGYASLTEAQIAQGVQGLGQVVKKALAPHEGSRRAFSWNEVDEP